VSPRNENGLQPSTALDPRRRMAPHDWSEGPEQMTPHRARHTGLTCLLTCAIAALALAPGAAFAAPTPSRSVANSTLADTRPAVGTVMPTVLTAEMAPGTHAPAQAKPFLTLDPGRLRAAKLRAAARASRGSRLPLRIAVQPNAGLFNGLDKAGLGNNLLATPPDSTGSIGPNNYVEMVNQTVGVYDRSLNSLSSMSMGSFTLASNWTVTDPQIQWDSQGNRWFYAALGVLSGNNVLLFGWSKTPNPVDLSNGWCKFGIIRGKFLDDYPKLGHDDDFVIIGTNVYDDTTAPDYHFVTANVGAIAKPAPGLDTCVAPPPASFFADGATPLLNADGSAAYTPVPANTTEASSVGYIVAAHSPLVDPFAPKVMIWHIAASGGAPSLVANVDVAVPAYDIPAPVPQPGTAFTLDTLDAILTQAVERTDPAAGGAAIWTQHTVDGPGGRSVMDWYEFAPASGTPLRQSGEVASPTDFVFNGAISPTTSGDSAATFYNRGGGSQLAVIGALSRSASTPVGTMDPGELLLGTSSAADQDFSCTASTPCRWGDYAGASPDPVNTNVVWGSSQVTGPCVLVCGLFAQWQTRNFAVEVPTAPPPPPTPPSAPQSLTATAGDASVSLTWAAPASDGGSPITDYTIYRGTSPGSEVEVATSGGALTYADTGLTNGQVYYYVVHAVNAVGEGPASNEASATPQATITPPGAPLNLAVAPNRPHGLLLNWLAPSFVGGSPVTAYQIWRGIAPGGEALYVTVGNVTDYIDAAATTKKTRYYYVVRAVNAAGVGPPSNEVSAFGH
jgi:hypothetical protein